MVLGEMKATRVADPLIDARVNQDLVARAVDPLIDSLADQDRVVRADAAKALGQIGDKRAIPPLLATLNDPNPAVECASAIALGTLRSSDAVNPLLALLKTQTNWVVGSCVVPALGDIGNSHPADDHISGSATYALGELRDPRAILPLARILKDAKRSYEAAAVALGKIGGPAIKVLAEALKDGEPKVRESAVLGLGVTESPEAIKPLVKALKDSNQDVRVSALTAIRRINPPDMKKIMIAAQKNPNQDVREGATQWLATKHNP
jgi:HEAT repeat protein